MCVGGGGGSGNITCRSTGVNVFTFCFEGGQAKFGK